MTKNLADVLRPRSSVVLTILLAITTAHAQDEPVTNLPDVDVVSTVKQRVASVLVV